MKKINFLQVGLFTLILFSCERSFTVDTEPSTSNSPDTKPTTPNIPDTEPTTPNILDNSEKIYRSDISLIEEPCGGANPVSETSKETFLIPNYSVEINIDEYNSYLKEKSVETLETLFVLESLKQPSIQPIIGKRLHSSIYLAYFFYKNAIYNPLKEVQQLKLDLAQLGEPILKESIFSSNTSSNIKVKNFSFVSFEINTLYYINLLERFVFTDKYIIRNSPDNILLFKKLKLELMQSICKTKIFFDKVGITKFPLSEYMKYHHSFNLSNMKNLSIANKYVLTYILLDDIHDIFQKYNEFYFTPIEKP